MLTVDYDRLGLRAGERLLDVGCGGGRHAYEALRRGGRVTAVDADDAQLTEVGAMLAAMAVPRGVGGGGAGATACGDALGLPFRDGSFDRVVAAEVLEHVEADERAVGELARVLRPGGILAVSVPRWLPEVVNWALSRRYHDRPGGHVRIYRRSGLVERLRGAGLRYRGRHHAHALHTPYWWLRCAVGIDHDDHPLVRRYHSVLVSTITRPMSPWGVLERLLDPLLGKSLVVYAQKPPPC